MLRAALEVVVFSSVWLAAAAGALCIASSLAMGFRPAFPVAVVACAGTLVIYSVDRLRDLEHDRATTPARSAFIARHARAMKGLGMAAGVVAMALGTTLGMRAVLLLAPVLAVVLAALGPDPVHPLAAIPGLTLASVIWFQPGERYGLVVVDGALLVGAMVAIGMLRGGPG